VWSIWSWGSSVSIVSDYGLDDQAIGVWSPPGAKDFSSNLCVQTGSEAHPVSCTMGTGSPFPGVKHGRGMTLTTHLHLVPRSRMSRSYTSSPTSTTMACKLLYFFFCDQCVYEYGTVWWLLSFLICNCTVCSSVKCQVIAYGELEKSELEAVVVQ
jgi:hypothetical protein